MDVLRKIKSATLVEALVATVLVVVIFMIASLILNNLVLNTFTKRNHSLEYRLNELEYSFNNDKIILPYNEEFEDWNITIARDKNPQSDNILFTASNIKTDKEIKRKRVYAN
ncbi:hypothetical protein [Flavobacterium sp. H122]|uniref:hypothetical protein n=1 Tax=Flavobacterium sp. H122 TaxID=2529860 RepID=UPI0010AA3B95|nr:hypothetical protein [Flavobacterium sp. H122]